MFKAIIVGFIGALAFCGVSFAQTCPAYSYTLSNGTAADAAQVMANFNTVRTCVNAVTQTALRGYISGLTLSTAGSSATFGISAGAATSSTAVSSMSLPSAYTKTAGSWAVGSGSGCLDTGAIANNTWYSEFLIQRTDTGVVDVLCSASATAPTLPSPYTLFRRIGSMKTNGSAQWIKFTQNGDEFLWDAQVGDAIAVALNTTSTLLNVTVPTGVQVKAIINALMTPMGGVNGILITSPNITPGIFNIPVGNQSLIAGSSGVYSAGMFNIQTNTSAQIRYVAGGGGVTVYVSTQGWVDTRGKDN